MTPGARRNMQAWMAARGEKVSSAAGVAALIGSRSADNVLALAQKRYRAVPACLITLERLQDNEPDECLYELSQPAQLGSVDGASARARSMQCSLRHVGGGRRTDLLTPFAMRFRHAHVPLIPCTAAGLRAMPCSLIAANPQHL